MKNKSIEIYIPKNTFTVILTKNKIFKKGNKEVFISTNVLSEITIKYLINRLTYIAIILDINKIKINNVINHIFYSSYTKYIKLISIIEKHQLNSEKKQLNKDK